MLGHRGGIARPATGGDPDEVEVAQREDDGEREHDHDLVAQAGQRHGEELPERAGAVDACRVVQVQRDLLDARHEEHHAQARVEPCAHQADRRQREVEVTEPGVAMSPRPNARSDSLMMPFLA